MDITLLYASPSCIYAWIIRHLNIDVTALLLPRFMTFRKYDFSKLWLFRRSGFHRIVTSSERWTSMPNFMQNGQKLVTRLLTGLHTKIFHCNLLDPQVENIWEKIQLDQRKNYMKHVMAYVLWNFRVRHMKSYWLLESVIILRIM